MKTNQVCLRERLVKRVAGFGLTPAVLAQRAGLDAAAVERVLADPDHAPHADVSAVGAAVGLNLDGGQSVPAGRFLRRAAVRKAKHIVRLVQGTSALEGQAVGHVFERRMVLLTARELLADRRKIWS